MLGVLETWLAGLYLATTFSGFYGLYLTRTIPRRLTALPTEVIYERIPAIRQQTAAQAKELVRQAQGTPGGTVIDEHHMRAVHFEEAAQGRPRVAAAEAVGAEHDVARVNRCSDHLRQRADVVGGGDDGRGA